MPIIPWRLLTTTTWPPPCSSIEGSRAGGGREEVRKAGRGIEGTVGGGRGRGRRGGI